MLIHGVPFNADYIEATSRSKCEVDPPVDPPSERPCVSVGKSEFSQLTVAGTPIAISGQPNQLVTIPSPLGGTITVVINEQTVSNGYLTVRALHFRAPSILGVVNASDVSVAM